MASKNNANGVVYYEETTRKKPKKFNFWRGIYNPDKNYILGRTPKNWGELFLFYTVFYIILGILFSTCMYILLQSIDDKKPKWTLDESRIGSNPGLGFRPIPRNVSQGSLIWLDTKNYTTIKLYIDSIDEFLAKYHDSQGRGKRVDCDFGKPPQNGEVCRINMDQFTFCNAQTSYGFNQSEPCIFLKLNRIFNWVPQTYVEKLDPVTNTSKLKFPEIMPEKLQTYIRELPAERRKQVFVSCEGQFPADREAIGDIEIEPKGIPYYHYPYENDEGYLSPLVSARFHKLPKHRLINIECIAWANNIEYHGGDRNRMGSIHFEIMID